MINEKYRQIIDIVRENNAMPVVIEYRRKNLKNYAGESITCHGYNELIYNLSKLSIDSIEIKKVYMLLFESKDMKDLFEEEEY